MNKIKKVLAIIFTFQLGMMSNPKAIAQVNKLPYILDMVHNNPGEPLTKTDFSNPIFLKKTGYTGQVINDFTFAHAAITFDKLSTAIFPEGSKERKWVLKAAEKVRLNIKKAHDAGIKVYYFTDIIVLPKTLVALYHDEICDKSGKISFERPKTIEIHRIMLEELFNTFPDLDGLVIRTGETYLNNVPYHTGNNPITNGEESHIKLINLLKEEVCVKRNKQVFYRTWSFGGMHDSPKYYLNVTNKIEPHHNLVFSIKHTKGDYHRTYPFNPCLGIGNHLQIVEVECQREYEGKGAFPNYVIDGVINGFEECSTQNNIGKYQCLNDLKSNKNLVGIWSWSRGGGWVGPYISNEFWCKLNALVVSKWGQNTNLTEEECFNSFMDENGIVNNESRKAFRKLCLLSAKAVLRGHESAQIPFNNGWTFWMRDEFLGGIDSSSTQSGVSEEPLHRAFNYFFINGLLDKFIEEKYESVSIWEEIVDLSGKIDLNDKANQNYIKVSCKYGLLLHQIIASGLKALSIGFKWERTGIYDKEKLKESIVNYDNAWDEYLKLKKDNPFCATLYKPYSFVFVPPIYTGDKGMKASVDKYRKLL